MSPCSMWGGTGIPSQKQTQSSWCNCRLNSRDVWNKVVGKFALAIDRDWHIEMVPWRGPAFWQLLSTKPAMFTPVAISLDGLILGAFSCNQSQFRLLPISPHLPGCRLCSVLLCLLSLLDYVPANTKYLYNIYTMLDQRRRQRSTFLTDPPPPPTTTTRSTISLCLAMRLAIFYLTL